MKLQTVEVMPSKSPGSARSIALHNTFLSIYCHFCIIFNLGLDKIRNMCYNPSQYAANGGKIDGGSMDADADSCYPNTYTYIS